MVHVKRVSEVAQEDVSMEGARNVAVQWLIDEKADAKNFAMRRFAIKKDGHTPLHSHDWEHEIYVLSGKGIVRVGNEIFVLEKDMVVYVPPNVVHQFRNDGDVDFFFLCMIPLKK
jgi:quercetin dioxygenase-like cupin family protein